MNRGDLSNQQWERLKPLLQQELPRTGKPNYDHRTVINRILTVRTPGSGEICRNVIESGMRQQGFIGGKKPEFGTKFW